MQDRQRIKKMTGALILTVLFLFTGCGGNTEETALTEAVPSGEDGGGTAGTDGPEAQQDGETDREGTAGETDAGPGDAEESAAYVYVCGAVDTPGVYEVSGDARVFEAVELAGGLTDDASPDGVNLARTVTDGEQIYVPTKDEVQSQGAWGGEAGGNAQQKKVNINTASAEELMTLTGIGEAKAASVIRYREEHGKFRSIEELMEIDGIKEGVFDKIKNDITI